MRACGAVGDCQSAPPPPPTQFLLWMDEILFAPLGNIGSHCFLVFTGESFQGFLGGVGFCPSTVWSRGPQECPRPKKRERLLIYRGCPWFWGSSLLEGRLKPMVRRYSQGNHPKPGILGWCRSSSMHSMVKGPPILWMDGIRSHHEMKGRVLVLEFTLGNRIRIQGF